MFNRIKIENELKNCKNAGFYEQLYHKEIKNNPSVFAWSVEDIMDFFEKHPAIEKDFDSRLEYMHSLEDFFEICCDYEMPATMLRWLVFYF